MDDSWIGRKSHREDTITTSLVARFRATFGKWLVDLPVPPGLHWCLANDLAPEHDLGRDGHPKPGIFVPALPLPRRMWAGGQLEFLGPIRAGADVARDSIVRDISSKTGGSGQLGFVTVDHLWSADGVPVIREQQDLVYREDPKPGSVAEPATAEPWTVVESLDFEPDPVLLFRYSAITFNGHRIHYDHPYATGIEGYDGLVVHGPLQAIVMLNLATRIFDRLPMLFRYRGVWPLICGRACLVEARSAETGLDLRVRTLDGVVTMTGSAR